MTGHTNDARADELNVYTVQHDPNDAESLSTAVVLAVAEAAQLEPQEIHQTIYEVIDPDALDEIFRGDASNDRAADGQISFSLADYQVTVDSGGTITARQDGEFE